MKNDALRDMIPLILLTILCIVSGTMVPAAILAVVVCGFYQLMYQTNQLDPKAVYSPKSKGTSLWSQMYNDPHPVIMPSFVYTLLGLFYLVGGIVVLAKGMGFAGLFGLFLLPISLYLWNWSSISFKMSHFAKLPNYKANPSYTQTTQQASSKTMQDTRQQTKQAAKQAARQAEKMAKKVMASQPVQDLRKNLSDEVKKTWDQVKTSTNNSDSEAARQAKIQRSVEERVLAQIEKNDQELQSIQVTFSSALDTIFGGSEITKARFQNGLDKALEMSAQNLEATREYVKVGHNPEVLQKFLNRSNLINKETGELLDALVTHQQKQMEDSLNGLTESLDELQESLKYYS